MYTPPDNPTSVRSRTGHFSLSFLFIAALVAVAIVSVAAMRPPTKDNQLTELDDK